ncbi:MAG: ubiquilin-like protein [Amphiamblys sp. WSBS2006]|nr:MAG: ubiquilin-like protein [Amphiamblys sp. WSBS2006]
METSEKIKITIKVKTEKKELSVSPAASVLDVKKEIEKENGILPENQKLIFSGAILKDTDILCDKKIGDGSVLFFVGKEIKEKKEEQPKEIAAEEQPAPLPAQHAAPQPFQHEQQRSPMNDFGQMQEMFAQNPEMVEQSLAFMETNPDLYRELMKVSPEFKKLPPHMQEMYLNPAVMGQMADLIRKSTSHGGQRPTAEAAQQYLPPGQPPRAEPQHEPVENPKEHFKEELKQLNEMGFWDDAESIRALVAANGNVSGAVEWLLANMK